MLQGVTYPATVIQSDVQSLCEQASPVGPERLKTIEEWAESIWGSPTFWSTYIFLPNRIFIEAAHARNAQNAPLVDLWMSVASDIEGVLEAIDNASRYNPDLDPDVWTYQMFLIERHCASANATLATMVASEQQIGRP